MVGVAVASPVAVSLSQPKAQSALPRGAQRDLYRIICALSGACERDSGVLRDGALVDNLELRAKQILRARRSRPSRSQSLASSSSSVTSSSSTQHRLSTSPVLAPLSAPSSSSKLSKRRKLPADYSKMDHSYGYDKSPLLTSSHGVEDDIDKASLYMSRGDGSSALVPSVKIGTIEPSSLLKSPYMSAMSGDVVINSVFVDPNGPRTSSPLHMEHLSLDKLSRPTRQSLDFGASMASTISSVSMHQYDMSDVEDIGPLPLTPSARYACSSSTYDYDHYTPVRGSGRRTDSYGEDQQSSPSTDSDDSLLAQGSGRRKDSCYSDASTASVGDRVTPKKLRFEVDALSLYEKDIAEDDLLHGSMSSFKEVESGLVETLQSQVDLLLTENIKAIAENARLTEQSQMSACEAEEQAVEKRRVVEKIKEQGEQLEELELKYFDTKQRADAQEDFRREAEVAFQAELDAKAELVTALQKQLGLKDQEIGRLSKRVEDISGVFANKMRAHVDLRSSLTHRSSITPTTSDSDEPGLVASLRENNLFLDMELERMRDSLQEKDREICNLYMHLSTKKKLIDEITKKFVQHMEETAAAAKASNTSVDMGAAGLSPEGVRFDLDMFLFKNVVDKQRRMEELTAALGVMDREVESLETRVAQKERENTQLRENQEFLTRSLQTANAQVSRIQADNERLGASLQEKDGLITTLTSSLEETERKVQHLDEQVDLRQMQDHMMSGDKGRRSLKSSFQKARASLSSSVVKGASRSSTSTMGDAEDASQRGSVSSVASGCRGSSTTPRQASGSLDWTDAHRPSVVMAQRSSLLQYPRSSVARVNEFAKAKCTSVFTDVFNDISAPISDDEDNMFGGSMADARSMCASYGASEITDDEELYNELFAKA